MSIWQFGILLLPEQMVRERFNPLPTILPRTIADDENWWENFQPPVEFWAVLDSILPEKASWSNQIRIWGDERADAVFIVLSEGGAIEEINVRIDVRNISMRFIRDVCALAKNLNSLMLSKESEVLFPEESRILLAIERSTAMRFLRDPVSTLRGLPRCED